MATKTIRIQGRLHSLLKACAALDDRDVRELAEEVLGDYLAKRSDLIGALQDRQAGLEMPPRIDPNEPPEMERASVASCGGADSETGGQRGGRGKP